MSNEFLDWDHSEGSKFQYAFHISRFLEYTDEETARLFKPLSEKALNALSLMNTILMTEIKSRASQDLPPLR